MKNYYLESRMESKNKTRLIISIILIIIITIVVVKVNTYNEENYYITEAEVTNVGFAHFSHKKNTYSIMYKYEVNGNEYNGSYLESINVLAPEEGEKIKIRYDKEDYNKSKPDLTGRYIKHLIMIIIFLVIMAIVYKIKIAKNNR